MRTRLRLDRLLWIVACVSILFLSVNLQHRSGDKSFAMRPLLSPKIFRTQDKMKSRTQHLSSKTTSAKIERPGVAVSLSWANARPAYLDGLPEVAHLAVRVAPAHQAKETRQLSTGAQQTGGRSAALESLHRPVIIGTALSRWQYE